MQVKTKYIFSFMNECTPETGPIKGFKHWTLKKNRSKASPCEI